MDMNHHHHHQFRPDFHIAQQSRRDKLRIQNESNSHHLYFNNLDQLPPSADGPICYDLPAVFCSEMIGYQDPPKRVDPAPYPRDIPAAAASTFDPDPPYFSTWKSVGSQSTSDWVTNHTSIFVGNSSSMKIVNSEISNNTNYQNALEELVGWGGDRGGLIRSDNTQALSLSLSSTSVPSPAQPLNHRNPGPLGPFTGYATILRSSKFLRPAQQLLEELCCTARPKELEIWEDSTTLEQVLRVSGEANSFASKDSHLHKKAKLLYMQDEVCKRYKQYHQQMQMVVSSFESVAGLSEATPYISLALKMVSKHFRCLKNSITDQLKSIKNSAVGEEEILCSPSAAGSSKAGDPVSMLKFFDQNIQKQKGILETQHIWRPQRGLPERAVSILRAWLFDHFLHPYPTDTDKHMLATQTGLTRNQVSNWFINARVRVWKPMVEEIHMLETKGGVADQTESEGGKTTLEGCDQPAANDQSSRMMQAECSSIGPSGHEYEVGRSTHADVWNQEKRSRIEYHFDGSLMGLVPSGMEMGGLGSVSLTLGLRQSAENAQRQPEHHFRPHMGSAGHIIRDFVG